MDDEELRALRRAKWHLDGNPVRTIDEARAFIESVGFCLMYPIRQPLVVPTFIGAWAGSDDRLPTGLQAFADPRAQEATDLMVRLLRSRTAYEAKLFEDNIFLVSASVFPYFYSLMGERMPRSAPKAGPRSEYSDLACDVFQLIQREGPISKPKMQEKLGGGLSLSAVDRALVELWSRLRITRVDYNPLEGAFWDDMFRWSPELVREGIQISLPSGLTALLSKYLDCVVAADQVEIDSFFSHFVPLSRVKESMNALSALRELSHVRVGDRLLYQVTPPAPVRPRRPVVLS